MFGVAGSSLYGLHEAVGLYAGPEGLTLVRLCAPADSGAWMAAETRTAAYAEGTYTDAAALAAHAQEEILRAGWLHLPLALALPEMCVQAREISLPAPPAEEEMRAALLWSLRASEEVLPADVCLCCDACGDTVSPRYWLAWTDAACLRAYVSAFAAAGLRLRRMTVCPPHGGSLAASVDAACEPSMPWETERAASAAQQRAAYAALLLRAGTPARLYWPAQRSLRRQLRAHAAALIAGSAAALFLAAVGADLAACMEAQRACAAAEEELTLHDADLRRAAAFSTLRADTAARERYLADFTAGSLPVRALLVHLGTVTPDGVRITGVHAAEDVRIEGEAADYEALTALMGRMEEAAFFSSDVSLVEAEQAERGHGRIRFEMQARW